MKNETGDELLKILEASAHPLTTKEVLQRVSVKCPDASVSMLVALMDRGIIVGEWVVGKGYVWTLPSLGKALEVSNGV